MIVEELTKAKNKEVFFEPCFSCFLLSLSSPFCCQNHQVSYID